MRKISSTNALNEYRVSEDCPIYRSTRLIAPRWRTHILWQLHVREMRFGELVAAIPIATERMIALRLRELVDERLVTTRDHGGHKFYALNARGRRLIPVLEMLVSVGDALTR